MGDSFFGIKQLTKVEAHMSLLLASIAAVIDVMFVIWAPYLVMLV